MGQRKIDELESVRGLAALLVVFFHLPDWHPAIHNIPLVRNGYLMVDLFFVLSGFVIHRNYVDRIRTWGELLRFQFLRFGRLYPVHLVMLAVFLLIECAKYVAALHGLPSANSEPFGLNGPRAFIQQLLLTQALGPAGAKTSFNSAAWSISTEFYAYLVFATIVLATRAWRNVIFCAIAACMIYVTVAAPRSGYLEVARCGAGFSVGCLVSYAVMRFKPSLPWGWSVAACASLIAFLSFKPGPGADPLIYPLSAWVILSLVGSDSPPTRVLRVPWLVGLGTISYSLYMCHEAVIWIANQVFRVILKRPEHLVDGQTAPATALLEAAIATGLVVAFALVASVMLYRLVEQPCRQRSRDALLDWKLKREYGPA